MFRMSKKSQTRNGKDVRCVKAFGPRSGQLTSWNRYRCCQCLQKCSRTPCLRSSPRVQSVTRSHLALVTFFHGSPNQDQGVIAQLLPQIFLASPLSDTVREAIHRQQMERQLGSDQKGVVWRMMKALSALCPSDLQRSCTIL